MKKIVVKTGVRRNSYKFYVRRFIYANGRFDTVSLDCFVCSDIGIVKSAAPYRFPGLALCVENRSHDVFYYHPRYRKWFVNLNDKQLDLYFSWLKPDNGLDKNKTGECSAPAGGFL